MGLHANSIRHLTPQNTDTLVQKQAVQVSVPTADTLKIKVKRPALKTFDFEAAPPPPRKVEAPQATPVEPEEVPAPGAPEFSADTLIFSRFSKGSEGAYFKGHFYPSWPDDSISPLTYDNFYYALSGRGAGQPSTGEAESSQQEVSPAVPKTETPAGRDQQKSWSRGLISKQPGQPQPLHGPGNLLTQDWFVVTLMLSVAITGLLRVRWRKYLTGVFSSILFPGVASSLRAENSHIPRVASFALGFLFYFNFSLFIYELLTIKGRFFLGLNGWNELAALFGFLMLIFTTKIVVYRFVGWVFRTGNAIDEYLFQSSLMSKAYALILMPLVVLFPFANEQLRGWLAVAGLAVFILLYLIQIGRGISINLRDAFSGYYIILYLCALEILPLSILFTVLFG